MINTKLISLLDEQLFEKIDLWLSPSQHNVIHFIKTPQLNIIEYSKDMLSINPIPMIKISLSFNSLLSIIQCQYINLINIICELIVECIVLREVQPI